MTPADKGLITLVGCSIVFAVLAVPLMLRKIPPNVVYGYRTRTTLRNPAIWYDANAHFGRGMLASSIISVVLIAALYRVGIGPVMFLNLSVAVVVVPFALATIATARYIRRLTSGDGQH